MVIIVLVICAYCLKMTPNADCQVDILSSSHQTQCFLLQLFSDPNIKWLTLGIMYHFFPGLFFHVYIESPNSTNPEGPTPQPPNPLN